MPGSSGVMPVKPSELNVTPVPPEGVVTFLLRTNWKRNSLTDELPKAFVSPRLMTCALPLDSEPKPGTEEATVYGFCRLY